MNDTELLQGFAERNSENAFRMLVERHLSMVMGTARRITNDDSLAEEVSQAVFILLARKARRLSSRILLAGWLYRTTCFVAARALRTKQRRRRREREAAAMHTQTESDRLWQQIRPQLDEAMGRLGNEDRDTLVLHFFEECSLRDVAVALGTSEEAAKKRVHRAIERLRRILSRRGIEVASRALASELAQECAHAVGATGWVSTVTAAAISPATAASSALVSETLAAWYWAKLKVFVGFGSGAVAMALLIPLILSPTPASSPPDGIVAPQKTESSATKTQASISSDPAKIEIDGQTIHLRPIQIKVLDKLSGNPISGAEVRHDLMLSLKDLTPLPSLRTDENGTVVKTMGSSPRKNNGVKSVLFTYHSPAHPFPGGAF
ncbi:MAG TPA: sigma-70 family RNA polymerase sigma factor, partial [Verrucomicrobiota bacterium]|nr:sigma-70 family RNA polymerase sigma factor [Verrucomicrobiota bacterium]